MNARSLPSGPRPAPELSTDRAAAPQRADLARCLVDARTVLFVPGDRPDRFDKAQAAGADLVVLDLEDAVSPDRKEEARAHVSTWLGAGHAAAVRINGTGTACHRDDVDMVIDHGAIVVLPKASPGSELTRIASAGVPVLALLETAAGVLEARQVAAAPGVVRIAFGSFDLAAELGVDPTDLTALAWARSQLVLASAAEHLTSPIDGVFGAVDDEDGLVAEVRHARRLGFSGKLLIHPRQVAPTAQHLRPTAAEIEWAHGILTAATAQGVVVVDGQMVDGPVVDRARRLLAGAAGSTDVIDARPDHMTTTQVPRGRLQE